MQTSTQFRPRRSDGVVPISNAHSEIVSSLSLGHQRSLLAYFMTEPGACDKFLHRISPAIFSPPNDTIVGAILDLHDQREKVNLITVANRLNEKGVLAECGGEPGIAAISTETTSEEIAESALDYILDDWRARQAAQIGRQLVERKISADEASTKLDAIQKPASEDERLTFRSPNQILAIPRPKDSNFLGDHLLALACSLVIAGVAGIGKTRLLLQLLVCLIIGRRWLGIETHGRRKRCLLIQSENSNARLQTDLRALKKWAAKYWPLVEEHLRIHTLETESDSLLFLSNPANMRRLECAITEHKPDIVSFDPLRDFQVGDLNTDDGMDATVRELGRISRLGNPLRGIIALHHALTGRSGAARATGYERTSFARNSKVLLAWTRAQINIGPGTPDNNETLVLACAKNNNGIEFPPFAVRLNPETMIYEVDKAFDIDRWQREISTPRKSARLRPEILRELLAKNREYDKKQIVALIMEAKGRGKTTAYDLIDEAERRRILRYNKQTKIYALA